GDDQGLETSTPPAGSPSMRRSTTRRVNFPWSSLTSSGLDADMQHSSYYRQGGCQAAPRIGGATRSADCGVGTPRSAAGGPAPLTWLSSSDPAASSDDGSALQTHRPGGCAG